MKLSELLTPDRVLLSMEVRDLEAALGELAERLVGLEALDGAHRDTVIREILAGDGGDLVRVDEAVLLAVAETEGVEELTGAVGVSPSPFRIELPRKGGETLARCVILVLTPRRISNLRVQAVPTLLRFFQEPERSRRLLGAERPEAALDAEAADAVEIHDRLLVSDALSPLQYRVYPDTPMDEVVDLMIRRGLHAVPVVGEAHEVLGILTSGDALDHLLPRRQRPDEGSQGPAPARDVMSRSVMCVSEDQPLVEAANTMINKNVAQLPVVREGELVGFLTRESVLRNLFGR